MPSARHARPSVLGARPGCAIISAGAISDPEPAMVLSSALSFALFFWMSMVLIP